VKVLPSPTLLRTLTCPLCASTIQRAMAKPRPSPSRAALQGVAHLQEAVPDMFQIGAGMPALIADADQQLPIGDLCVQRDRPVGMAELDRVVQQVVESPVMRSGSNLKLR